MLERVLWYVKNDNPCPVCMHWALFSVVAEAPSGDDNADVDHRQCAQLKLALAWNRSDIAKSNILVDDHKIPPKVLVEQLIEAVKLVSLWNCVYAVVCASLVPLMSSWHVIVYYLSVRKWLWKFFLFFFINMSHLSLKVVAFQTETRC